MVMQGMEFKIEISLTQIIYAGHYRASDIQTKTTNLQEKWKTLKVHC